MSNGIPVHFQLLDPGIARKALEGQEDVLSSEHKKAEALYRQHTQCRNGCGTTMEKSHGGVSFAFSDTSWLIPRCLMKCHACGFCINPFDGMIVEPGNKDVAKFGHVPILKKTDG